MPYIAYYRVSPAKQGRSKMALEAQCKAVLDLMGTDPIAEFTEVESGRTHRRPELEKALALGHRTGAIVVVGTLDRLSRNAVFLGTLMESGLNIMFADMPEADRSTIAIMTQLAAWEREQNSARAKEGMQRSKARGVVLGGDRGNLSIDGASGRQRSRETRSARSNDRKLQISPFLDEARSAGHSTLRAIAAYLNDLHIPTSRGGEWHAQSVARLIE